jgi:predicted signal transduction protein with EAL and GGDEF domain
MDAPPPRVDSRLGFLSDQDRPLARTAGVLQWATGALTAPLIMLLTPVAHEQTVLLVSATCAVWAVVVFVTLRDPRRHVGWWHVATCMGFPVIIVLMAATGGAVSPARFYLWLVVSFAASFFRASPVYIAGAVLALATPLLYDPAALGGQYVCELLIMAPLYVAVGGMIALSKREVVRLRDQAEVLSFTDALTGLANRRALDDRLAHELARSGRSGRPAALVTLDVDHFKAVNDSHGHDIGDRALVAVADVLRAICRTPT